jgi:hypothetical protein
MNLESINILVEISKVYGLSVYVISNIVTISLV